MTLSLHSAVLSIAGRAQVFYVSALQRWLHKKVLDSTDKGNFSFSFFFFWKMLKVAK